MTISLDEQMLQVNRVIKSYEGGKVPSDTWRAILLSLRRLKRTEELMREPSERMMAVGYSRASKADYIAMSAALRKQVEEEVK